ncbi:MAG TPA: helix-turn-helix domain-containing protein [Mycobacteriales bacterium]
MQHACSVAVNAVLTWRWVILSIVGSRVVRRAHRYHFYPAPVQVEQLARTFGCVRYVYNRSWLNVPTPGYRDNAGSPTPRPTRC